MYQTIITLTFLDSVKSLKKYRGVYKFEIGFKQSLLIAVILCTLKRWSLIRDFGSVYRWHESFQSFLWHVKHDEYFGIQKIWQNTVLHVDDPVQSGY
ncbi:hypothetical protein ICM_06233 [Bacillus cereus BAG1X2-3]|nr:hypothetical protein ICC_06380 [Bacillus cereus BAG1X1-1]EOO42790.1 hypothetical protein ICI_06297 [Bacillus cereus BAG1X2-1]EOO43901.1 hypothetical protein ICK_06594 [Bacillus cereus BAG1X2-2]EOO55932.1 hypothetical protein ICM_06233 [Bacillus cereus BAG1X2-3]EOO99872.1 hypothetical protein ICO_06644 [Bacillus cereus BAG2O-1]